MRIAAFLILLPLIAGCNVHSKNPAAGDDKVTINAAENGEVTFNLPFASGQVKLPEGALGHGDFDIDGVKMIPGATITGFNLEAGDKGGTVNFAFKAPGSQETVRAYFADQFRQKGVNASVEGTSVSGKTRDGDPFVIRVEPAGTGSQGSIAIQSKH